jgi:hypothetical protein
MDFTKIQEAISTPEGAKNFFTDIANALQVLIHLLNKLFKAFAILPKYADPADELYAGDATTVAAD